jgi:hypothetical protein
MAVIRCKRATVPFKIQPTSCLLSQKYDNPITGYRNLSEFLFQINVLSWLLSFWPSVVLTTGAVLLSAGNRQWGCVQLVGWSGGNTAHCTTSCVIICCHQQLPGGNKHCYQHGLLCSTPFFTNPHKITHLPFYCSSFRIPYSLHTQFILRSSLNLLLRTQQFLEQFPAINSVVKV